MSRRAHRRKGGRYTPPKQRPTTEAPPPRRGVFVEVTLRHLSEFLGQQAADGDDVQPLDPDGVAASAADLIEGGWLRMWRSDGAEVSPDRLRARRLWDLDEVLDVELLVPDRRARP